MAQYHYTVYKFQGKLNKNRDFTIITYKSATCIKIWAEVYFLIFAMPKSESQARIGTRGPA